MLPTDPARTSTRSGHQQFAEYRFCTARPSSPGPHALAIDDHELRWANAIAHRPSAGSNLARALVHAKGFCSLDINVYDAVARGGKSAERPRILLFLAG